MVDTSPSVIITPTTFFHHIQHAEEYRQAPAVGSFLRWVRTIGIATSLFIIPFWLLLVIEPTLLPAALDFIGPEETNNIPIQFAGAGTLIPVTGFMNAMTSAALEYKSEGLVYGIGAHMFKLTGAIIAIGVLSSYLVGLVRLIIHYIIH